jgi:hypothetical protein
MTGFFRLGKVLALVAGGQPKNQPIRNRSTSHGGRSAAGVPPPAPTGDLLPYVEALVRFVGRTELEMCFLLPVLETALE